MFPQLANTVGCAYAPAAVEGKLETFAPLVFTNNHRLQPLRMSSTLRSTTLSDPQTSPTALKKHHITDKKTNVKKDIGTMHYSDLIPHARNGFPETKEFLLRVVDILLDYIEKQDDRSSKILDFHHPEQLKEVLDLNIPDKPQNLDQLLVDCKDALKYQVKTGHPHFFNQLSSGLDLISMAGEWLTATANTNMFTYEIAPVFILMETITMKKMREIIGWKNGDGDSILAPGGSISNLYAVMVARHKLFPELKEKGLRAIPSQLVLYTSEHSHYSIKGAAATMGIGTDNTVEVPTDSRGRMIASELERLVQKSLSEGKTPFFVNCTAGTTVLGAFDPISDIGDICEKYHLWFHVDAAWGGGLLLSKKYRQQLFAGVERAHSVTWNPHKLMGSVFQCSTIHFSEDGLLLRCNQMSADYLFQQDKHYDVSYDTGDKVMQCGRHNDIFKLWLMWRGKGMEGYDYEITRLMELAEYMVTKLKEKKDRFYLILEPEMVNVSFWYIPTRLRSMPHGPERMKILGEITPTLKGRMMNKGTLMIGYQPEGNLPNFFRTIISNQAVTREDIDFQLEELDRLGHDL